MNKTLLRWGGLILAGHLYGHPGHVEDVSTAAGGASGTVALWDTLEDAAVRAKYGAAHANALDVARYEAQEEPSQPVAHKKGKGPPVSSDDDDD